ncbi:YciI family protein [Kangiella sp. HZ709]|uniref:YciI family protein n=1 Tax=Kangiella sp. HZ709 TaxID=2666328 RepID=UPI0012AF8C81|nr:YciI family protein [Kangiella sp. HZ709]MRX27851.1 YciI family protein [Kangiella sp. HZ709]
MQYLLMIYAAESAEPTPGSDEFMQLIQEYDVFTEEVKAAGAFLAGEPLEPVSTATTVQVRNGERFVIDGPFAETKEVLGGYYLLDCENLDQALEYAAKIPSAKYGSVEVRPIMQLPG